MSKNWIISCDVEFDEIYNWIWSKEETKVVGLFFDDVDDDGNDCNTENGGYDDPTHIQNPKQQTTTSTPPTSISNSLVKHPEEYEGSMKSMMQQVQYKILIIYYFV